MATRAGRHGWQCVALGLLLAAAVLPRAAPAAEATAVGSASGLPVPRFVSLKSDRVNLREGPSKDHRTSWVFQRAGLPVEITAEFETWRRIRDSEGAEGWVLHSLLSGRRTGLVAPWSKQGPLHLLDRPDPKAQVIADLQPGVLGTLKSCTGTWCRLIGSGFDGWIQQDKLWGAYPGEKVD
jgi:SH3-like domain-containing protein